MKLKELKRARPEREMSIGNLLGSRDKVDKEKFDKIFLSKVKPMLEKSESELVSGNNDSSGPRKRTEREDESDVRASKKAKLNDSDDDNNDDDDKEDDNGDNNDDESSRGDHDENHHCSLRHQQLFVWVYNTHRCRAQIGLDSRSRRERIRETKPTDSKAGATIFGTPAKTKKINDFLRPLLLLISKKFGLFCPRSCRWWVDLT